VEQQLHILLTLRLSSSYTGALIRVRRSSDNTEQDIGYDGSNVLDESALTSFVGAGNGFVTKIYDQSGNGKDASQASAGNQPRIVASGTVVKRKSKPAIHFGYDGTAQTSLINSTISFNASNITSVGFGSKTSSGAAQYTYSRLYSLGGSGNDYDNANSITSFLAQSTFGGFNPALSTFSSSAGVFKSYTYDSNLLFWSQKLAGGTPTLYIGKNGDTLSSSSTSSGNITATKLAIGGTINSTADSYLNGYITEYIVYTSDKTSDRTGIEGNINTYYSIY
jgi:hypothetical protein